MARARPVGSIAAVALLLLTVSISGGADAATRPRRVTIYGDSLTVQAEPYLHDAAETLHVDLTVRAYPGTAPCDYVPVLATDLASRPLPDLVVFAFSGNSFITCMRDASGTPLTGDATIAKYRADVGAAVDEAVRAGRPIVLASPPISVGREAEWHALDAFDRELAATRPGVHYLDAGRRIAPHGRFALTQRCLPAETRMAEAARVCHTTRSRVAVRSPDGLHFCGNLFEPPPLRCPEYASGAWRYATNLVRGATHVLGRRR